jgi:tetratricopeptide (TPR) repeat protein
MRRAVAGLITLLLCGPIWALDSAALDAIRAQLDAGNAVDAIRSVESLHERGEASAESHYLLGLAYQIRLDEVGLLGKRRVAGKLRGALEAALEIDPGHVGAREELADFFFFAPGIVGGSKRKAREQIEALEAVSAADAHRVRGRHAHDTGEYRDAEAHFSRALELREDGRTSFLRGNARARLREKDAAALEDYERALALGYDKPMLHYQVGRLCVRLANCAERGERALEHFVAHSEGRNQAFGRYRLAQLHEQNDRLEQSRAEARAALALEPELQDARALLERVERKLRESGVP